MKKQKQIISIADLLEIENLEEIFQEHCSTTRIPIWVFIRITIFRKVLKDLYYGSNITELNQSYSKFSKVRTLIQSSLLNSLNHKKKSYKFSIMLSGWGLIEIDGKHKDRLGGDFYEIYPDNTIVLSELGNWMVPRKRFYSDIYYTASADWLLRTLARIKVRSIHYKQSKKIIDFFILQLNKKITWQIDNNYKDYLINFLAKKIAASPYIIDFYQKLFVKHDIKVLLKEDGCFGHSANVIYAAKSASVIPVEFQHGAISLGHDGYNFGNKMFSNPNFINTLPNYFLSYGEWWNNQTNIPCQKVIIGCPSRDSLKKNNQKNNQKKLILVIGDGLDTEKYLNLCRNIYKFINADRFKLSFRPHPMEREALLKLKIPTGCNIDTSEDLYDVLSKTFIIISEISTVLFEAIGIVDNIYCWYTQKAKFAYPDIPFNTFYEFSELRMLLESDFEEIEKEYINENLFWAPNWKKNYINFIDSLKIK